MKLIRKGTFETNSSSTHALVIPHKVNEEKYTLNNSLDWDYEFGRCNYRLVDKWDEKLAYLYIVINELNEYNWVSEQYKITQEMIISFKNKINKFYEEIYKKVKFKPYDGDPKPNDIFRYIEKEGKCDLVKGRITLDGWRPYVDHVGYFGYESMKPFLKKIFNDDEFLKRFIFNEESYITIGGDEYGGYNIKTIGFEYDYEDEGRYCVNENWEEPPKEWFKKDGRIKEKYWERYCKEYPYDNTGFWKQLKEYEKENDVFLKGN